MRADKILGTTWKIRILTILFYAALTIFIVWFIKINVEGFNQSTPPLTPEEAGQQWQDDWERDPRW